MHRSLTAPRPGKASLRHALHRDIHRGRAELPAACSRRGPTSTPPGSNCYGAIKANMDRAATSSPRWPPRARSVQLLHARPRLGPRGAARTRGRASPCASTTAPPASTRSTRGDGPRRAGRRPTHRGHPGRRRPPAGSASPTPRSSTWPSPRPFAASSARPSTGRASRPTRRTPGPQNMSSATRWSSAARSRTPPAGGWERLRKTSPRDFSTCKAVEHQLDGDRVKRTPIERAGRIRAIASDGAACLEEGAIGPLPGPKRSKSSHVSSVIAANGRCRCRGKSWSEW